MKNYTESYYTRTKYLLCDMEMTWLSPR